MNAKYLQLMDELDSVIEELEKENTKLLNTITDLTMRNEDLEDELSVSESANQELRDALDVLRGKQDSYIKRIQILESTGGLPDAKNSDVLQGEIEEFGMYERELEDAIREKDLRIAQQQQKIIDLKNREASLEQFIEYLNTMLGRFGYRVVAK